MSTLIIYWILGGLITAFMTTMDFMSATKIQSPIIIVFWAMLFFILDMFIWPLYLLGKALEWLWHFRRNL